MQIHALKSAVLLLTFLIRHGDPSFQNSIDFIPTRELCKPTPCSNSMLNHDNCLLFVAVVNPRVECDPRTPGDMTLRWC